MAKRTRQKPETGWVAPLEPIQLQNGQLSSAALDALVIKVNEIAALVSGLVSLGDGSQGSWAGNLDAQYIEVTFPAAANTEQSLFHSLGRRVSGWHVSKPGETASSIYESRNGSWTADVMYLKSTVGGVTVTVKVW